MKRLFLLILLFASYSEIYAQNQHENYRAESNQGIANIKNYDQQVTWEKNPKAKFNAYLNPVGIIAGTDWCGPISDVAVGVRFNRYYFLGAETGIDMLGRQRVYGGPDKFAYEAFVPLALNAKGLLTVGKRCCPFVEGSIGGYFGVMDLAFNGLFIKSGLGFEFNRFVVSAGYIGIPVNGYFYHVGNVRLGFRIGR